MVRETAARAAAVAREAALQYSIVSMQQSVRAMQQSSGAPRSINDVVSGAGGDLGSAGRSR